MSLLFARVRAVVCGGAVFASACGGQAPLVPHASVPHAEAPRAAPSPHSLDAVAAPVAPASAPPPVVAPPAKKTKPETPKVVTVPLPTTPVIEPGAFDSDCQAVGRCLWAVPAEPKPGDFVMFETQAPKTPGTAGATLSVFGKDIAMFRVGDRLRAFVGVPLNAKPAAFQTRLWLSSAESQASFRCMDALVAEKEFVTGETLRVARRFTRGSALADAAAAKTTVSGDGQGGVTWVEPMARPPLASLLFVWPRPGVITSGFGTGRIYNGKLQSRHMGLDIEGKVGDNIFAANTGVVRYSGKQRSTGNTIILDHGGGVLSFYMHMASRLKQHGERVRQGELIGYVGRTGRVTGPHLHFAVSVHGRFVDPASVLDHPLYSVADTGMPCVEDPALHSVR